MRKIYLSRVNKKVFLIPLGIASNKALFSNQKVLIFEPAHDKTYNKAKTQISLYIRAQLFKANDVVS